MHFKLKLPGRKKFIAYLEESLENIKEAVYGNFTFS